MIPVAKKRLVWILAFLIFIFFSNLTWGGFGISPPFFRNDNLTRGSHFEEKIILARGDPVEDSKVTIIVNVPGADDWIKIDKGNTFILPKGEKSVPMVISVDVPPKANYGRYKGFIRVMVEPAETPPGQVGIALGARIEVDLNVVESKIANFLVRAIEVLDSEEGHKWWLFFIPARIKMKMKVENLGNIEVAPSKVHLDIYDASKANLLESIDSVKIEGKVPPFQTKDIFAIFQSKLPQGSYWGKFKIFKGKEIVREGELVMAIRPRGTLAEYQRYNLFSATLENKKIFYSLIIVLIGILILLLVLLYKISKKKS